MADTPHLFSVGDAVICEMLHGVNASATCSIVKLLPPVGTQLQYRIKYNDEKFERVVVEGQLSPMDVAA